MKIVATYHYRAERPLPLDSYCFNSREQAENAVARAAQPPYRWASYIEAKLAKLPSFNNRFQCIRISFELEPPIVEVVYRKRFVVWMLVFFLTMTAASLLVI